jgi:hypothetical protein
MKKAWFSDQKIFNLLNKTWDDRFTD